MTEPDTTGPSPATIGPRDAPPHAGQVIRRVLLRRNADEDFRHVDQLAAIIKNRLKRVQYRPELLLFACRSQELRVIGGFVA